MNVPTIILRLFSNGRIKEDEAETYVPPNKIPLRIVARTHL